VLGIWPKRSANASGNGDWMPQWGSSDHDRLSPSVHSCKLNSTRASNLARSNIINPFERPMRSPLEAPANRRDLMTFLDRLGIQTTTVEHPAVFTVKESELHDRILPGGHTKNLFLKDAKDKLFLVIAEAHATIDMKLLHKTLGSARLSFGRPELLLEVLGITPGSVTAFSLINDTGQRVTAIIDANLMAFESVNCHPLVNTATTNINRDDLLTFLRATGHEPRIEHLPSVPQQT
jgi:Ala-tRNA(Pro) deacylase